MPFGERTSRALMRYLNRRHNPQREDTVFLQLDGRPLTENAIKLIFQRLKNKTGISRLHIHLLRHTFATNYLRANQNPFTLQSLLGHETLEMTRRYVDMVRLEEIIRDPGFSPVDRLGSGGRPGRRFLRKE